VEKPLSDQELVTTIRSHALQVSKLCREARDRGISVRVHCGTNIVVDVLRELEVVAERIQPL
jgi:hypothetical protein